MDLLKFRKLYYVFSGLLIAASFVSLAAFGLKPGIDFAGGTILEIEFMQDRPAKDVFETALSSLQLGEMQIQATGEKGYVIRMKHIDEETHQAVLEVMKKTSEFQEKRFDAIGPVIGRELRKKAIWATLVVMFGIMLYIAWAFRKTRGFISGWRYGLVTLLALFHDLIISVGAFSLASRFMHYEANIPFLAALLLVLGYSVTDTVVVFDRVRENIIKHRESELGAIISQSLNQTIVRSLNTSFTTLFVILTMLFLGGETLKGFAYTLAVGVAIGTYSSIFIAAPLLFTSYAWRTSRLLKFAKNRSRS